MQSEHYQLLLTLLSIIVLALLTKLLWRSTQSTALEAWRSSLTTGSSLKTEPYTKVVRSDGLVQPATEEILKALQSALQETSSQTILDTLVPQIQDKSKASFDLPLACIYTLPQSKERMDMETLHLYGLRVTLTHTQRPVREIGSQSKSPPSSPT